MVKFSTGEFWQNTIRPWQYACSFAWISFGFVIPFYLLLSKSKIFPVIFFSNRTYTFMIMLMPSISSLTKWAFKLDEINLTIVRITLVGLLFKTFLDWYKTNVFNYLRSSVNGADTVRTVIPFLLHAQKIILNRK